MVFSTRLTVGIGFLAALFFVQGALTWWVSDVAQLRVERGRLAGDLQAGFIDLLATKQRLRAWSLQVLIGASPPPIEGDRLSTSLIERADRLAELGRRAEAVDRAQGKSLPEHAERSGALVVLRASFRDLREAVLNLPSGQTGSDPVLAWQKLEQTFDLAGAEDLRSVLDARIVKETAALNRERAAADASLQHVKRLAWLAATVPTLLALLIATYFALALRRPLAALTEGARALQSVNLEHRLPDAARDEFGQFARSINSMAAELQVRRAEEATARQLLETRVAEQTADLQMALASVQEFEARRRQLLADISHELRTPTTVIRGEAEIAQRGGDRSAADYRATLQRIGDAAVRLGDVIDDLLTVARSDADALAVQLQPVDLRSAADRAVRQTRGQATLRNVQVEAQFPAVPITVMADPARLVQLIELILDNAIRYSHVGGTVTVDIRSESPADAQAETACVVLSVSDNGIGIEPEEMARIFERHFRSRQARVHRPEGTGIGLAIADALASRQGVAIAVDSKPGVGTVFSLRFGLQPVSAPKPTTVEDGE
jgi:signal transduction histidine kinase